MSMPSQDTLFEELCELRRRIKHFASAFFQTGHRQESESWKSCANAAIAELSYSLIATAVSVAGIADIVLNYAKVFTQSEYGYVSSIAPVTGDNLCRTLAGMIGDSCKIPETQKGFIFPMGHIPLRNLLSVPAMIGDERFSKQRQSPKYSPGAPGDAGGIPGPLRRPNRGTENIEGSGK